MADIYAAIVEQDAGNQVKVHENWIGGLPAARMYHTWLGDPTADFMLARRTLASNEIQACWRWFSTICNQESIVQASTYLALLRGINVTGHNTIPMAELRQLCAGLGWSEVQSFIQSGNLVFRSEADAGKLEGELEAAILAEFGFEIPVVVRTAQAWVAYVKRNPFPAVAEEEPNRLLLTLSKGPPKPGAADALNARADKGERVAIVGDSLYMHYPEGVGRSKLTPALLDRLVGSPVTARNWRTVLKLADIAGRF